MALEKKTKALTLDGGRSFVLTRPGRGGVARIARRIAGATDNGMGMPSMHLTSEDGRGIEMEAVLVEYVTTCPEDWIAKDKATGKPRYHDGTTRPILDLESIDAEEFATVGEEALAFHATFRDVDRRFGHRAGDK